MKKKLIGLLLVLVFVCTACFAACQDNSEAIINGVVFDKNGMTVSSEFVLSAEAGDKRVTWTSDNPAIELVLSEDGTEYVAKINPPEDKQVVVTLTVSLGNSSKQFTVKVNPITADDIADEYLFPKKNATVVESFDLATSTTYKGKTATIKWSVEDDKDKDYIEVVDNKCKVTVSSLNPEVTLTGKFTYNGETVTRNYKFTVSMPMTHLEEIDYWYNNTGVGRVLKGYVVAIAEAYPKYEKYISFYLLDLDEENENNNAGYYIYRLDIGANNKAEADKIVPGVYMEITGKVNTTYNGLYETNNASGATWTIDNTKTIKPEEHIYALDNDILAGSPAERRHTGTLVSLTNWKVQSVATTPDKDGKEAALVLEKEGKTVQVSTSKYMTSFYEHTGSDFDTKGQAIANLCKTYKAGDVVSVTGLLSYYAESGKTPASTNGIQILPRSADDVKAGTADAAGTVYDGVKVGAVIAKINEELTKSGLSGVIVSNKEATMPATQDGVTVAYKLCSTSNAVKLEGTKITVTPQKNEKVNVQVDLTSGTYTTTIFFSIESKLMTDAQIVEAEKTSLSLSKTELSKAGSLDLITEGQVYDGVTIEWAKKDASAIGTIANGKYTVSTLPEEDAEVVLVATIKRGEASAEKEIKITVKAATYTLTKADVNNLEEGKAYKLVMDQDERGETLFAKGQFNGYYLDSTTDATSATDFYIEKVEGGVKLSFKGSDGKPVYLGVSRNGTFNNIAIGGKVGADKSGTGSKDPDNGAITYDVWTITADGMSIKIDATTAVCLGTQTGKSFNTFSFRNGATAEAAGVYGAYLGEVKEKISVTKVEAAKLEAGKEYKLVMNHTGNGKIMYATGSKGDYYLNITDDVTKAASVYVEAAADGKWNMYFLDGTTKKYINVIASGTYDNMSIDATATTAWTITDECIKAVCPGSNSEKFIGTYSDKQDIRPSALSNLTNASNYVAYLAEVKA